MAITFDCMGVPNRNGRISTCQKRPGVVFETSASLPHCPSCLTSLPFGAELYMEGIMCLRGARVFYRRLLQLCTHASSIRNKLETPFELGTESEWGRERRLGTLVTEDRSEGNFVWERERERERERGCVEIEKEMMLFFVSSAPMVFSAHKHAHTHIMYTHTCTLSHTFARTHTHSLTTRMWKK